jgi:hypothetical protein
VGGWHDSIVVNGTQCPYAVIPSCASLPSAGLSGVDAVTAPASHEWIEAVTDPYGARQPAYASVDAADMAWVSVLGNEIGDLCSHSPSAFTRPTGLSELVQRTWSNAAAAASQDPCVPTTAGEVYFNSAGVMTDTVTVSALGQRVATRGVTIPVGQTRTIEVDLFSGGPTDGPWTVRPVETGSLGALDFGWTEKQGINGDRLQLPVTVREATKDGAETFVLVSSLGKETQIWVVLIGN